MTRDGFAVKKTFAESDFDHRTDKFGSYLGTYDCGCADPKPVIEKFIIYSGVELGISVCANCNRAAQMQIQANSDIKHEVITPDGVYPNGTTDGGAHE